MKLIGLIIIGFVFTNCAGDTTDQEIDNSLLSNEYDIVHFLDTLDEALIYAPEMTYIDSVYMWVDSAESTHNELPFGKTIGDEEWTYNQINNNLEIVYVKYQKDEFAYTEEFVLLKSELIYAVEWEEFGSLEANDLTTWNCTYFLKKGSVVDYSSLGHGETERDEWEPESIFQQWEAHGNNWAAIKQQY